MNERDSDNNKKLANAHCWTQLHTVEGGEGGGKGNELGGETVTFEWGSDETEIIEQ